MDINEIETCVSEGEFHLHRGPFSSVEEFGRCVNQTLELIALFPKVAKAKSALFSTTSDGGIEFSSDVAAELFRLLGSNPFRLMSVHQGARFHPILELCLEACTRSPRASTILFEQQVDERRALQKYTGFDLAQALNDLVAHVSMGFKSQVFKEALRKWHSRCRSASKRVEVFLDRLAKSEPFVEMSSFSLIEPSCSPFSEQLNHVRQTKDELVSNIRARLPESVRGVVMRASFVPEGTRYDVLLILRNTSPFSAGAEMSNAWQEVTRGAGDCYCLDGKGSRFAYRSMSLSQHLPATEQRRRLAVYFGFADWLTHWSMLGRDALSIAEFKPSAASWPFANQRVGGRHSTALF
ncbi:hypothetical protein HNP48_001549 [Acidovorax soli]|uniref:Uncharacterized protein n=1 Tax=Acidovorax soli TaxID=592050 RepID=A0A7X0U8W5_9BURK|nr:hypothetical protein [Acidovorax soli]MBB6558885.1 hypothetical protein [Acidovorax soli]